MLLVFLLTTIFMTGDMAKPTVAESAALKPAACKFFTYENAEKLIGRSTGADSEMQEVAEGLKWSCTFTASDKGENPPKLYFVLYKATSEEIAKQSFETVRQSNKKRGGFEEWPGVGDEAVVHSDAPNFHFVMVRKGVKTIRVKINPAGGVSLDELKNVARSLTAKL
jgi:hypothetical protein